MPAQKDVFTDYREIRRLPRDEIDLFSLYDNALEGNTHMILSSKN